MGVYIVNILDKTDRVITAPHCISMAPPSESIAWRCHFALETGPFQCCEISFMQIEISQVICQFEYVSKCGHSTDLWSWVYSLLHIVYRSFNYCKSSVLLLLSFWWNCEGCYTAIFTPLFIQHLLCDSNFVSLSPLKPFQIWQMWMSLFHRQYIRVTKHGDNTSE